VTVFHISIGEKGLLYPEVYNHIYFRVTNCLLGKVEFREACIDKNRPVLVEVVGMFSLGRGNLTEEILEVYPVDIYTRLGKVKWAIPASSLKPPLLKE
jgi:hypothetical protein